MYRVVVNSKGKHNNVALGARYCFTKRIAIELATLFESEECDCVAEKFVYIGDGVFCWSEIDAY